MVPMFSCEVALPLFRLAGGPFVRGDGLNVRGRRCWRQAGEAKNLDRYRPVTLRRQEKTPRPARMQIRGFGDRWLPNPASRFCASAHDVIGRLRQMLTPGERRPVLLGQPVHLSGVPPFTPHGIGSVVASSFTGVA